MIKNCKPEEAFIIALKNCKSKKEKLKAINKIEMCDVGTGCIGFYDDFIVKNTAFKFCYGCQCYHDTTRVEFCGEGCKESYGLMAKFSSIFQKQRLEEKEGYHR